jgi:hypothetical protein
MIEDMFSWPSRNRQNKHRQVYCKGTRPQILSLLSWGHARCFGNQRSPTNISEIIWKEDRRGERGEERGEMRGKGIIYLMEITYVGAMPGKLLQCLKQVFLLFIHLLEFIKYVLLLDI